MKYRNKPVVIEAFRFKINNVMPDWFNEKRIVNDIITYEDGSCDIKTLEGTMKANLGDYIIRGVQGEVYPCKPDIFEQIYEAMPTIPELATGGVVADWIPGHVCGTRSDDIELVVKLDGELLYEAMQEGLRKKNRRYGVCHG